MERYTLPISAAYTLFASATRRKCRRGTLEALANMEAAAKRSDTVTAYIGPNMAWLESGAIIGYLFPVQARRWLHEHQYKEEQS